MNMKIVIAIALGAGFLLVLMVGAFFFFTKEAPPEAPPVAQAPPPDPNTLDPDGDGVPTGMELAQGTNPNDKNDYPALYGYVARTTGKISEAATVDETMLAFERVKKSSVPSGTILGSSEADARMLFAKRMVSRSNIPAETLVKPSDFLSADRLSAVIPRFKRAVTIPMSAIGMLSNLVKQGDVVDVIGNFQVKRHDDKEEPVTKIVIQGATILALGQSLSDVPAAPTDTAAPPVQQAPVDNVTLAVTPMEAETLLYAANAAGQNNLRLILRSPNAKGQKTATPGATRDTVYGPFHTLEPIDVELYKGTKREIVGLDPVRNQESRRIKTHKGGAR